MCNKHKLLILVLTCTVALCTSCGTYMNMEGGLIGNTTTYPYGGVASDMILVFSPLIAFAIIDLPFTVVGDTVTLPYILYTRPYCKEKRSSSSWNLDIGLP